MDGQVTLVYVDTLTEGGGGYVQPVILGGSMDGQVTLVYVDTLTEGGVCATGPSWRIHGWPSNF